LLSACKKERLTFSGISGESITPCSSIRNSGYDIFYLIRDKYLPAEEFDLVLLDLKIIFQFGEIEHTGEGKRIIHVQVDPEQRLFGERIELPVKIKIVLVF
jgi:hypothetical protein